MYCIQDFCLPAPLVWAIATVVVIVGLILLTLFFGKKDADEKPFTPARDIILAGNRFPFFPNETKPTPVFEVVSVDPHNWKLECKVVVLVPTESEVLHISQGYDSVQITLKYPDGKVVNQQWILEYNYPPELDNWQVSWSIAESGS